MSRLALIYSLVLVTAAFFLVAGIVEGSRWVVTRWRRWQVQLMVERCALETAPTFCGRNR
jgi:hypothetical protein